MQSYHLDLEPKSSWLRATPVAAMQQLGFYCTEAGIFYCRSNFNTRRSSKNSYLLFYTFSGCGQLECGDSTITVKADTLLFLNCRVPHYYGTKPGADHWSFYWAHIDGDSVAGYFSLLGVESCRCFSIYAHKAELTDAWQQLVAHARQHTLEDGLATNMQIHRILQVAAAEPALAEGERNQSNVQVIENAAAYLRAHYTEPLSLAKLARQAALSESYFIRLFRQQIGTTPYDYLLRYRITKSKVFLSTTALPVSEIAEKIGFGSASNYVAQFSRLCGLTPLQYRQLSPGFHRESDG